MNKENYIEPLYSFVDRNEYFNIAKTDVLFESCHNLQVFDAMIDSTVTEALKQKFKEGYVAFYTGWNFDSKNKECVNDDRENTHKIYFILIDRAVDSNFPFASLLNRKTPYSANDDVNVVLNMHDFNVFHLRACLKHEMTHAFAAYCKERSNALTSRKNSLSYEANYFNLSDENFSKIKDALYFINASEQEARINATVGCLSNFDINNIFEIIEKTEQYNQLQAFESFVNEVKTWKLQMILCLGYYLQFHHYIYGTITREHVIELLEGVMLDKQDLKNTNNIFNFIKYNFSKYRHNLYSAIINAD